MYPPHTALTVDTSATWRINGGVRGGVLFCSSCLCALFRSRLVSIYVDGNIEVGMSSVNMARGTLVHSASPQGAG